jgi:hypothetical protein
MYLDDALLKALKPAPQTSASLAEEINRDSRKVAGRLRSLRNDDLVTYRDGLWSLTPRGREAAEIMADNGSDNGRNLEDLPNYNVLGDRLGLIWPPDSETEAKLGDPGLCRVCGARCVWQNLIGDVWIGACTVVGLGDHRSEHVITQSELKAYSADNPAF